MSAAGAVERSLSCLTLTQEGQCHVLHAKNPLWLLILIWDGDSLPPKWLAAIIQVVNGAGLLQEVWKSCGKGKAELP